MHPDARLLLRHQRPILDVRAPLEFARGHLPASYNAAILNDEERSAVGTLYKQQGASAAQALGYDLVSGEVRDGRISTWLDLSTKHGIQHIMCWRGGQRSQIAQRWLKDAGLELELVSGGYKAMRHACMQVLEEAAAAPHPSWLVLAGQTGCAKTKLLHTQPQRAIDLEGLARHRGSAFGRHPEGQPTLPSFENALSAEYLGRVDTRNEQPLLLEDESRMIGRIAVPEAWHKRMQQSPLVLIEADLDTRVAHIRGEYVDALQPTQSNEALLAQYLDATQKISRRLGGVRTEQLTRYLRLAFSQQGSHEAWISYLLTEYYDPMYNYQLEKKQARIVFRGDYATVQQFLSQ